MWANIKCPTVKYRHIDENAKANIPMYVFPAKLKRQKVKIKAFRKVRQRERENEKIEDFRTRKIDCLEINGTRGESCQTYVCITQKHMHYIIYWSKDYVVCRVSYVVYSMKYELEVNRNLFLQHNEKERRPERMSWELRESPTHRPENVSIHAFIGMRLNNYFVFGVWCSVHGSGHWAQCGHCEMCVPKSGIKITFRCLNVPVVATQFIFNNLIENIRLSQFRFPLHRLFGHHRHWCHSIGVQRKYGQKYG